MNILLIGFCYAEIEAIQDRFLADFPQFKIDFAISIRDSWHRLKISCYDLIILDATSSETDSRVTYGEIAETSNGIPVILITAQQEIEKSSHSNEAYPKMVLTKQNGYLEKLIAMLKKEEATAVDRALPYQLQLQEDKHRTVEYFHTAINTILDPLFIVNSRFEIIEANNALLDQFQVARKAVLGKFCYQIIHRLNEPCDPEQRTCPLQEIFRLGVPFQSSFLQANDSEKIIVKATPIWNELNQIDLAVVTFHRETVAARDQQQPIFNKSLLELMLSGLSDGLLFCNAENKILLLNQAAETILGVTRAKLINRSIFNLPLGEGRSRLNEVLNSAKIDLRFNSMAFKTRINNHLVQIRFAPIFSRENFYLGGFLYLTEAEETTVAEKKERQFLLNDEIFGVLHLTAPQVIAEG